MTDYISLAPVPTRPPQRKAPALACDSHAHIFGPPARFALANASYQPPAATVELYLAALAQLGVGRGVLVQAAPYGEDNSALLDALGRFPDRLRGIALASASITDDALGALAARGVRGLRFSYFPGTDGQHVATIGLSDLQHLAPRLREHGLHAQLWMPCEAFVDQAKMLLGLGIPLVLDHLARVRPEFGTQGAAFQAMLSILGAEDVWLKLTPHRASAAFPDYPDIRPFHLAALANRPQRLVWGTDWPFVRMGDVTPNAGHLLDLFDAWTNDDALCQTILVDNPARLYGFDG